MKCCKKSMMILGIVTASIASSYILYNYALSPRTKRKMASLEDAMCDDFENMI